MARNYANKVTPGFDYKQLQSTLINSGLQRDNPALYNTITKLIDGANIFQAGLSDSRKKSDLIDLSTDVDGMLDPLNGGTAFGTYFPPITPVANVNTFSTYYSHVIISKKVIQVSGKLNIKATAAAILTQLDIQLPIHSKFNTSDQLQGVINGIPLDGATEGFAGIITGNVTDGQATVSYYPINTDNHDCRFILTYELL